MPLYEVPRVELHVRPMLVAATSVAQARAAVRAGKGVPVGPVKFEQIGCTPFRGEPVKPVRDGKDYAVLADANTASPDGISLFLGDQACTTVYDAVSEGHVNDVAEALSLHLKCPVRVEDTDDSESLSRIFCLGISVHEDEIKAVREAAGK